MLVAAFLLGGGFAWRSNAPARSHAVSQTLHAQVGPDFQISLSFDDGTPVTNLPAGTYTVQVKDLSDQHNFHLFGPGVDQKTTIETTSEATWTVTFQDQNGYSFQCDAHSSLTGNFTVGNLPAPAPVTTHEPDPLPAPPPAPTLPLRGVLRASVGPKPTISLVRGRKLVRKLPHGIYDFVIADRTKKDNFTLRQVVGGDETHRLTPTRFVGTKRVSVELAPGKWKVYSSVREQLVYAFFDVT
jgi:hypothetical protein